MAIDGDRNRVLAALRDRTDGMAVSDLVTGLSLGKDVVERHVLYCADYGLATWKHQRDGLGLALITERGRDYLARQGL
jgi:hypothetical protein